MPIKLASGKLRRRYILVLRSEIKHADEVHEIGGARRKLVYRESCLAAFAPDLRPVLSGVWAHCQNPILLGQAPSHIDNSGSRRQRQRQKQDEQSTRSAERIIVRQAAAHGLSAQEYQRMVAILCGLCTDCVVMKLQA